MPLGAIWAGSGIGRAEFPMVAQALLLGSHVRVGMEDNLYMSKGVLAKTNAELVTHAIGILRMKFRLFLPLLGVTLLLQFGIPLFSRCYGLPLKRDFVERSGLIPEPTVDATPQI